MTSEEQIELIRKGEFIGVAYDLPEVEYFAAPGVSNSYMGDVLSRSFAFAEAKKRIKVRPTAAMDLGKAIHCAVLERASFKARFAVAPDVDRRTTIGKTEYAKFMEEHGHKIVISHDDYHAITGILESVEGHAEIPAYLSWGAPEVSLFWRERTTGVLCKARVDYLREDLILVDIKSTENAGEAAFSRAIAKYGYYRQAALYLDGVKTLARQGILKGEPKDIFCIVAVEKVGPLFGVNAFIPDEGALDFGRMEYMRVLKKYAECQKIGEFPGYSKHAKMIALPNWKINEYMIGEGEEIA